MSTDDVTTLHSPCPCGNGTISVTQTMPDHPWVRASQIHYSAGLECAECSKSFAITDQHSSSFPRLVEKSGLEAKAKAQAAASAARAELDAAPEVEQIKEALILLIDAEPTKAAKHRFLQSLHLTHLSYGSFIKEQMAGAHLLKWKSGSSLIQAGVKLGLPQAVHLTEKCTQVEKLQAAVWNVSLKTVPTGARWMAA